MRFFALPFLILLCCSAYSDAWDVCIGLLIAGGLCVPRVIGCIAYYNNCRPEENHIAQWGVMIAGMLMSWIMIIAIAFWVAMPQSFWNVGSSEFIWTGKCSRSPSGCNDSPRLGSTVETKPRLAKERMDCPVHTGSILYHLVRHCIVHHGFPESHPCTPHSLGAFVHRRTAHCVRENM